MIDGPKVTLGGAERILAPLNLKTLKRLSPKLVHLQNMGNGALPTVDQFDLISEMVLASLQRNYPEITLNDVDEWLDTANMIEAFVTILRSSGFNEISRGEADRP